MAFPMTREGVRHDWLDIRLQDLSREMLDSWEEYQRNYSHILEAGVARLRRACFYCRRCRTLVPEVGVRPDDEDCDALVVRRVMES